MRVSAVILDRRQKNLARKISYKKFSEILQESRSVQECCEKMDIDYRTLLRVVNESTQKVKGLYEKLKKRGNNLKGPGKKTLRSSVPGILLRNSLSRRTNSSVSKKLLSCKNGRELEQLIESRLQSVS